MSVIAISSEESAFEGYARGGCVVTGARYQVPASAEVISRFAAASGRVDHEEVSRWSVEDLREMVARCSPWKQEECEHLLVVLSSHGSPEAFDLVAQLRAEVPEELKEFSEIAFARTLGWLGLDYHREPEQTAPAIASVEMPMTACA